MSKEPHDSTPGGRPTPGPGLEPLVEALAGVLDLVSDGAFVTNRERRILAWNRAAETLTGYTREEALAMALPEKVLDLTDLDGNRIFGTDLCPLARAMAGERGFSHPLEVRAVLKSARQETIEIAFSPLQGGRGDPAGCAAVFRPALAKRALEEEQARFFSAVSHELKTPLANMQGYLGLLLAGDAGELDELQQEFIEIVYSEEQKLSRMIDEILELDRFESAGFSRERTLLDLSAALSGLVDRFGEEARQKGLPLEKEIAPGLKVIGDQERLEQAFANLIGNAIRYSEKGTITVKARHLAEEGSVEISVSDLGLGISPRDREAVFEMFYRVENPGSRSSGGAGVGLYVVKRIIEGHDGKITVSSAPGKGSTFTVLLPGSGNY